MRCQLIPQTEYSAPGLLKEFRERTEEKLTFNLSDVPIYRNTISIRSSALFLIDRDRRLNRSLDRGFSFIGCERNSLF